MNDRASPELANSGPLRRVRFVWPALFLVVVTLSTNVAQAHADVDRGVAAAMDADFESALTAFKRAVASGELTRAELTTLLGERALVWHALGKLEEMKADLRYLASLDATHDFRGRAPPAMMEEWSWIAIRSVPVTVSARTHESPTGVRVAAEVRVPAGVPPPFVRISTRQPGGVWRNIEKSDVEVNAPPGSIVEYHVEAIGLGGATIAAVESEVRRTKPAAAFIEPRSESAPPPFPASTEESWMSRNRGWVIGASALTTVLAVAAVVFVTSTGSSSDTRVTPMVEF